MNILMKLLVIICNFSLKMQANRVKKAYLTNGQRKNFGQQPLWRFRCEHLVALGFPLPFYEPSQCTAEMLRTQQLRFLLMVRRSFSEATRTGFSPLHSAILQPHIGYVMEINPLNLIVWGAFNN